MREGQTHRLTDNEVRGGAVLIGATDEEPQVVNIQEEATVAGLHTLISHPQTLLRRSFAIPLLPGPYQQELCQILLW